MDETALNDIYLTVCFQNKNRESSSQAADIVTC